MKWLKRQYADVVRETPYGEWRYAGECVRCHALLRASGQVGEWGVDLMQLLTCEQCQMTYTLEVRIKGE